MSADVYMLDPTSTMTCEQALARASLDGMSDVLIAGYDQMGQLVVMSSRMTCAEAAFLAQHMLRWAMSGGECQPVSKT